MFTEYVCEDSWANRLHRGWTALASFAAQAVAVAILLILPLFYTQALPRLALLGTVIAPAPPPAPGTARAPHGQVASSIDENALRFPAPIPRPFRFQGDSDGAASGPPGGPGVVGIVGGDPGGTALLAAIGSGMRPAIPAAPLVSPPRVSHVMEGNLIRRVQPDYPALARQARIQGTVVLRAVINREGTIQDLQVIGGHPLLVQAAINAVRQWRYRPFYLNDQAVEVETQVTVNFSLAGG